MTGSVWVTGAKGFIGRHLCKYLAARGSMVYGIGHGAWNSSDARVWGVQGWVEGEIDEACLTALLSKAGGAPERIYHLAGGASVGAALAAPHEDFKRTVATTATLLEWLRIHAGSASLVAISSAAVYGAGHQGQIAIEATHIPFSPYGFHKLAMEQLCRAYAQSYALKVSIVRLFSVYGPMLQKQLLWDICSQLAHDPTSVILGGTGDELRDWTYIDDVVRFLDFAGGLAKDTPRILNAGTGIGTSVRTIAESLIHAWGSKAKPTFSGVSRPGDPQSLIAKPQLPEALDFAWHMEIARGAEAYVTWYKQHKCITL